MKTHGHRENAIGSRVSNEALDLLTNPVTNAFLSMRECEAYYCGIEIYGRQRRFDFNERLFDQIGQFATIVSSRDNAEQLNRFLSAKSRTVGGRRGSQSNLTAMRAASPIGFDLLNVPDSCDLAILKDLYRAAVRVHHPDRGGKHEAMVAVNSAYRMLHDELCNRLAHSVDEIQKPSRFPHKSTNEYLASLMVLMISALVEESAYDRAFECVCRIEESKLFETTYFSRWANGEGLVEFTDDNCLWLFGQLIIGLVGADMRAQGKKVGGLVDRWCKKRTIKPPHTNARSRVGVDVLARANEILAGTQKPQIGCTLGRSADNAMRLGIITPTRYRVLAGRQQANDRLDLAIERRIRDFVAEGGFLHPLVADGPPTNVPWQPRLVPEVMRYYPYTETWFVLLSEDQRAEYRHTFCAHPTLSLLRKYGCVRLESLLRSVIYDPSQSDLDRTCAEYELFAALAPRSGVLCGARDGLQIVKAIMDMSEDQRSAKLPVLRQLDTIASAEAYKAKSIEQVGWYSGRLCRIAASHRYLKTFMLTPYTLNSILDRTDPTRRRRSKPLPWLARDFEKTPPASAQAAFHGPVISSTTPTRFSAISQSPAAQKS